ncbi:MAG: hypothetical protein ACOC0N_07295 [Chroococcales cyanobacterium]
MLLFIQLFVLLLVACLCIFLIILVREIAKQKQFKPQRRKRSVNDKGVKSAAVPSRLQKQLLSMVGGDAAIAARLLTSVRHKHPGKDEIWYWEKVIGDLERDRR